MFVLPFWLQAVWRHLGADGDVHIALVRDGERTIGAVPLAIDGTVARFLGNPEVCDYQDLVAAPEREIQVMATVIDHLQEQGIQRLDLRTLRPDALVLKALKELAPRELENALGPDAVTYEAGLPGTWDDYLMQLSGKQRHEVRRKLRRLENHGAYAYRAVSGGEGLPSAVDIFLDLFQRNRRDKARFMDETMSAYFQDLIDAAARHQMLRLYILDVEDQPVAAVLCFDYDSVRYLYNSGYDAQYEPLSVGILSKVLSIRHAVETGCRRYDFLKGDEVYKKRIGGARTPLYRCRMEI